MTSRPETASPVALVDAIRREFGTEYAQVEIALSAAATRYAEEVAPALLMQLPAHLQGYINHGSSVAFRYQGLAAPTIALNDVSGVFPGVCQIPLLRLVVCPRHPAVLTLDLQTPAGVAVDAALAAMEELLDRIGRRFTEITTITIEKVPNA